MDAKKYILDALFFTCLFSLFFLTFATCILTHLYFYFVGFWIYASYIVFNVIVYLIMEICFLVEGECCKPDW